MTGLSVALGYPMTPSPDELREHGQEHADGPHCVMCRAAADAWEADRKRLEAAEEMLRDVLPVAIVAANEYGVDEPEWADALERLDIERAPAGTKET